MCNQGIDPDIQRLVHTWKRLPETKQICKGCSKKKRQLETDYGCVICNTNLCNNCFRELNGHKTVEDAEHQ